jgi:hypothetical protein
MGDGLHDRATIGERGIVVNDQHGIGRSTDVEFDPVGAHLHGGPERRDGVLGVRTGCTTMSDHGRHRDIVAELPTIRGPSEKQMEDDVLSDLLANAPMTP